MYFVVKLLTCIINKNEKKINLRNKNIEKRGKGRMNVQRGRHV